MQEVFTERYGATESQLSAHELNEAGKRVDAKFGTSAWMNRVP